MKKKRKGGLLFIILLVMIICGVIGSIVDEMSDDYSAPDFNDDYTYPKMDDEYPQDVDVSDITDKADSENVFYTSIYVPEYRSKYYELDDTGKTLYRAIREALLNNELSVYLTNVDGNNMSNAAKKTIYAIYYDFPEFFWINRAATWKGNYNDFKMDLGCYDYWTYTTDRVSYVEAVEREFLNVYGQAKQHENVISQIRFIHDYFVSNFKYNDVALEEINNTVQRASSQQSHTVYGALVNREPVCNGYSKTFQMIATALGIEVEYIDGDSDYGPHAWNIVKLEEDEYWMDITWDDRDLEYETGDAKAYNHIGYSYYLSNDKYFTNSHQADNMFTLPLCTSMASNYHFYNRCFLNTYDFESVCMAIENQEGQKHPSIRFADSWELKKAVEDLFENNRYKDIPVIGKNIYYYFYDEKSCVLELLIR